MSKNKINDFKLNFLPIKKKNASEDVVRMLVGNKCDLAESRLITKERGEQVAIRHAIPFMETSAKTNLNVSEAFREISLRILEKVTFNQKMIFRSHS